MTQAMRELAAFALREYRITRNEAWYEAYQLVKGAGCIRDAYTHASNIASEDVYDIIWATVAGELQDILDQFGWDN